MSEFLGNKTGVSIVALFFASFLFSMVCSTLLAADVSAYTASLSTSGTVTTNVAPNTEGDKSISINQDSVNVVTNCRAGYNLTISSYVTDRNLYKDGNSSNNTSGQYFTPVNGTAQLNNTTNQYGYSLTANTESGVFTPLPLPSAPTFLRTPSQTASQTDINDDIPVYYGVSAANTLNPGLYKLANSGTVLYQLTLDESCMTFTVNFNANGGTGTMTNQDITVDRATNLKTNSFTAPARGQSYRDANGNTVTAQANKLWTFWGWNTEVDGSGDWYKDRESVTNLANNGDTITLYAQWKQATLADLTTSTPGQNKTIDHNTMQDMSAATCYNSDITTKAALEAAGKTGAVTLTDNRDGTTRSYDVSKLADGNCWMTTNLALGTTSAVTLTSDDTDLEEGTTFTLPAGDTTSSATSTNARIRLTNESGGATNGVFYSWAAAVASTTARSDIPTTSICPRNWDLPTNDQYLVLSTASAYSTTNPTTDLPSQFKVDGGFTNGATFYQTTYGFYWTSTSTSSSTTTAYGRRVNTTTLYSSNSTGTTYGGNKYYRKNIRCVASQGAITINYNANDGSGATSSQTAEIGAGKLAAASLFTPGSYKQFKEWNTKADGTGTSYAADANVSLLNLYSGQSIELYAIWDDIYYIAFNANESSVGGTSGSATGTMTNQTVIKDTATAIKTNTFALTGYIFLGWNTKADGTGTFYSDGQKVTNLTTTGNTITLYAVWSDGAYLDSGSTVNQKLKRLAGNSSATYDTQDTTITALVRSNSLPNDFTPATENTISHSTSPFPIYAWYDSTNTTIYYYSEATDIIMNKTSSNFFYQMRALSNLSTISTWDTTKVTTMTAMFYYTGYSATTFILDLSSWDTASVTIMQQTFSYAGYNATTWSVGNLSSWNTSSVVSMHQTFSYAGYNATTWSVGNLSSWNTSGVTDMQRTFWCAGRNATTWSVGDLSSWDTSRVTVMFQMFLYAGYNATTWSVGNLSSWNTSNVTSMGGMFSYAGRNATTWSVGDLSNWNTSNVTNISSMFSYAGYSATTWSVGDLSNWNTSNVTNISDTFSYAGYSATTWSVGDLSSWNTSSVTSMYNMFSYAGYSATAWSVGDLSSWNTSSVTNMSYMFSDAGYSATTWSVGDLSSWNTSSVTNMQGMFSYAGYSATAFTLNLSSWNTSSVTTMYGMFYYAGYNATTWSVGDLSSWNTSDVTSMTNMFQYAGCGATTWSVGDLSSWNTSDVTSMSSMFYYAGRNATTWSVGDLSSWNTSNVTNLQGMFYSAGYSATTFTLDLSSWNTSSVTNMNYMFSYAGYSATIWSITIPKTNNGTTTGPITNTTSNLYGNTTSVTATPPSGRSFTLAN